MLEKNEILPVGSIVTVDFNIERGEKTILVIAGHLTLQRNMISRYDYTCVKFPMGTEKGLFYINHTDIVAILYESPDYFGLHEAWMTRKYAEYRAYYHHFPTEQKTNIQMMNVSLDVAAKRFITRWKARRAVQGIGVSISIVSAGFIAVLTGELAVGFCVLVLFGLGYIVRK